MVGETKGINHLSSGDPPPIYFTSQQVLVSDWICKPRWYFRRLESVVVGFAQPIETHSLAFGEDAACRIDIFEALGKTGPAKILA